MHDLKWSAAEKKIARRAYGEARQSALARIVAEFKARAAAVTTPDQMFAVEDFLRGRRREMDELLDYLYSQLVLVFARLIYEGHG